jgi:hypothetical protein
MSSQKKLIEDILSSYDIINENKKSLFEATDVYANLNFKDNVVGNSTPSKDNINVSLLQDIQTAAKSAGLNVDVTTAITGHKPGTRHETGNAVDIAIINNKAVNLSNRGDADKLVAALVSMGYRKNAEGPSNPKSVLTFGFEGHDNHVHVSNTGGESTQQPTSGSTTTSGTESGTESSSSFDSSGGGGAFQFAKKIGSGIVKAMGIQESFDPSSFGVKAKISQNKILIPKGHNSKIKSPVSGKIVDGISNNSCINQIAIQFSNRDSSGYLEYCGITTPSVKIGDRISGGDTLGTTTNNVTVSYYSEQKRKISIDSNSEDNSNKDKGVVSLFNRKTKDKNDDNDSDNESLGQTNNEYAKLFRKLTKNVKKSFYPSQKKVDENIERIKGLIK